MTTSTVELAKDVDKAYALLEKLTAEKQPVFGERIPAREFRNCQGLAFTFVKKVGLGITIESGHGFVVAKKQSVDGIKWSAPLFISIKAGGAGLTLGYSEVDSVIVLDTPEAVTQFTKPLMDHGTDAAAVGPLGHVAGAASVSDSAAFGDSTFSYSAAKGTIVDFSYQGMRYTVDVDANLLAYGQDVTPEAILSGSVESPAAIKRLEEILTRLATSP